MGVSVSLLLVVMVVRGGFDGGDGSFVEGILGILFGFCEFCSVVVEVFEGGERWVDEVVVGEDIGLMENVFVVVIIIIIVIIVMFYWCYCF